jgi:hypothetical protein
MIRTHFPLLREKTGLPYESMLYFDDCNWDDHVSSVARSCGVLGIRTPHGMHEGAWREGLTLFARERSSSK